jgi:hypothetical protein
VKKEEAKSAPIVPAQQTRAGEVRDRSQPPIDREQLVRVRIRPERRRLFAIEDRLEARGF